MDYKYILLILSIIIAFIVIFYFYKKSQTKAIKDKDSKIPGVRLKPIQKYELSEIDIKKSPYLDIFIGDKYEGRIVFELFDEIVPKTCMNFRYLVSKSFVNNGTPALQNTMIDMIVKDNCIIAGQSINFSIFGNYFNDENYELEHNQPGLLAMYKKKGEDNNSSFMITMKKNPDFNKKYVVFGIVKTGYEIIEKLNTLETNDDHKPLTKCKIVKSGLLEDNNKNDL